VPQSGHQLLHSDDGQRSAVLSTARRRADNINCCTATDEAARSAVLSTTHSTADDINCCTVTDDDPRSAVLSTTRHRADDINCCTVMTASALQYSVLRAVERTTSIAAQ